jgi:hypothetical protein
VKTVIIKLINYGGRLGENIQCNLNIKEVIELVKMFILMGLYMHLGRGGGRQRKREREVQKHNF